jgi:dual specificity phosphatase 3
MDFTFVTFRLATGAAVSSLQDIDDLIQVGITHIIDTRIEFDDATLFMGRNDKITYLWNGTADDGVHPKPVEWFNQSIEFALSALARPNARLLCHCAAGINRGPSTAYAILRSMGLTRVLAENIIRSVRPQVGLAYKEDADLAIASLGYGNYVQL